MARKTRKVHCEGGKKRTASKVAKRKEAASKRSKAARKKSAPRAKGVFAEITGGLTAVIDTLSEAERLLHKLEPRMAADPE